MKKYLIALSVFLLVGCIPGLLLASGDNTLIEHAEIDIHDIESTQRGAKIFVNYCLPCHSASYMRYNRLAEDLNLSEELVMQNLVFSDAKIGETMDIAMRPEQSEKWLGKTPPDLSLIARSRGVDWLFSYMKAFYQDESGGWNNRVLSNASMPHVMWRLQGIQKPVYASQGDLEVIDHLTVAVAGLQSPQEYDGTVRDLVTFLDYLGEPAKLKRKSLGIWVMLFLAAFAAIAYALKAEFWRDIH